MLEQDFTSAIKSAIPAIAHISIIWKPIGVCLRATVCSSYGAETIKLQVKQEAIFQYIKLSPLNQSFARHRMTEYFAKRFKQYQSDPGCYFQQTRLLDPEWTLPTASFVGHRLPARQSENPSEYHSDNQREYLPEGETLY